MVIEIRGGRNGGLAKVKLAIEAPDHIKILREEIANKPPAPAEAACDVKPSMMDRKGLAGANAEREMYLSGDPKQIYTKDSKQWEG